MKRIIIFLITLTFALFSFADMSQFEDALLFSWHHYFIKKGKSEVETLSLIKEYVMTSATQEKINEAVKKATEGKWEPQNVEFLKVSEGLHVGLLNPQDGIRLSNEAIAWILKWSPENKILLADAYRNLSSLYLKLNDYNNSVFNLTKAIELDDQDDYRKSRMMSRFKIGDEKGSDEDREVLEKRCPNDPRFLKYKETLAVWKKQKAEIK